MSEQSDHSGTAARHTFAVTHFIRQPGDYGGWQSIASAEHSAAEAIAWIRQHVAGSRSGALDVSESAQEAPVPASQGTEVPDAAGAASAAPRAAEAVSEPPL